MMIIRLVIYVDKIYHKMSNTTRPFVEENPGLGKLQCKRKYNLKKYVTKNKQSKNQK